jgi:hypothetical protein
VSNNTASTRPESENEKAAYIRENPVRAGLIGPNDEWRYAISGDDLM